MKPTERVEAEKSHDNGCRCHPCVTAAAMKMETSTPRTDAAFQTGGFALLNCSKEFERENADLKRKVEELKKLVPCDGAGACSDGKCVACKLVNEQLASDQLRAQLAEAMKDKPFTLTQQEIRHLALFCGMVVAEPTEMEKEDERVCEIVIAPWPTKGVKGDDGMLPPHKHIAYLDEYPEEGCIPLGEPIAAIEAQKGANE